MILVDTSIWVRWFRGGTIPRPSPNEMARIVTCAPILQELLQGFKDIPTYGQIRSELLALPRLTDPMPIEAHLEAAEIYRLAKRKGFTIRSSIDCLIAAIAIREDVPVMHDDRDFDVIARFTSLRISKL
jgi:predicted nucleic acid-binding protein